MENRIAGVWVKASERLPEKNTIYFYEDGDIKSTGFWNGEHFFDYERLDLIKSIVPLENLIWLYESQPIPVKKSIKEIKEVGELDALINTYVHQNGDETHKDIQNQWWRTFDALEKHCQPIPINQGAVALLMELCKLKHYKDTVGKDSFYEKRQPELWKEANDFLNNRLQQPTPVNQDDVAEKLYAQLKFVYEQYADEWTTWNDKETEKILKEYEQLKSSPSPIPVQEGLREDEKEK